MHGIQRHRRINKGFTLGDGAGLNLHVDDVCAQTQGGEFEGGARAGRVLEEQVHDRATFKALGYPVRSSIDLYIGV